MPNPVATLVTAPPGSSTPCCFFVALALVGPRPARLKPASGGPPEAAAGIGGEAPCCGLTMDESREGALLPVRMGARTGEGATEEGALLPRKRFAGKTPPEDIFVPGRTEDAASASSLSLAEAASSARFESAANLPSTTVARAAACAAAAAVLRRPTAPPPALVEATSKPPPPLELAL